MLTSTIHYGLLIALAIALVFAAFTDVRRRQIKNWLNGAIALGAPAFWWSSGLSLWPDLAMQLGVALAAFALLAGLFALKMMGGGDVKLLTVLALWIPWDIFLQLLMVMAIAGGGLTIVMGSAAEPAAIVPNAPEKARRAAKKNRKDEREANAAAPGFSL